MFKYLKQLIQLSLKNITINLTMYKDNKEIVPKNINITNFLLFNFKHTVLK